MSLCVRFLGAAGTVTGSKHLVTTDRGRVLLDCGMFQGLKALRLRNWEPPDPALDNLEAVVLSHAHLDHSGALPLLVRRGYRGPIYCTDATADLLQVMLLDAAHLQEEEARFANRRGFSRHHPALPLYTVADAEGVMPLLRPQPYGEAFAVSEDFAGRFRHAGHILGSATVELTEKRSSRTILFSGDLGRWDRPIVRDPDLVRQADFLLIESTYGDRDHPGHAEERLVQVVREVVDQEGVLLIPAFAVGRTQDLVWMLRQLEEEKRIPELPVYLDSPMAIDVTGIYTAHPEEHDLDMQRLADADRNPLRTRNMHLLRTPEQSKSLNARTGPMIIISASGMATGGRILHHLAARLPDPRTTVLLPGFQAAGTRGRTLQEGATQVRIHGQSVVVRAKVVVIDGLSAHAGRSDLLRWLEGFESAPRRTFVVHGEPHAADQLAAAIRQQLGWSVEVAEDRQSVQLG